MRTISVDATLALNPNGHRPLFHSHLGPNTNPLQCKAILESRTVLPNLEEKNITIMLYSQSFQAAYCPHLVGHEICTYSINSSSRWGQ